MATSNGREFGNAALYLVPNLKSRFHYKDGESGYKEATANLWHKEWFLILCIFFIIEVYLLYNKLQI